MEDGVEKTPVPITRPTLMRDSWTLNAQRNSLDEDDLSHQHGTAGHSEMPSKTARGI